MNKMSSADLPDLLWGSWSRFLLGWELLGKDIIMSGFGEHDFLVSTARAFNPGHLSLDTHSSF